MSTFVKGLAWFVALLSGIATIFALFGGQQWLEQQGWTLAPDANAVEQTADTTPDDETDQASESEGTKPTTEEDDTAQEPKGQELTWAGVRTWSEDVFDNLLWGIAAIGFSMLIAGAAGALILHGSLFIDVGDFFKCLLAIICIAIVVIMGILLHGADPGYLVWFIVLTVLSALLGFIAPVLADGF